VALPELPAHRGSGTHLSAARSNINIGSASMELAVITLIALACSTAMNILAFMIGRCGRKLPIDGMLPHVVYSAQFSPDADRPRLAPEPARHSWPYAD
jgi:hypothetical protein